MYDHPHGDKTITPDLFNDMLSGNIDSGMQGCIHNLFAQGTSIKYISGFEISNVGTTYTIHSGWAMINSALVNFEANSTDTAGYSYVDFYLDVGGSSIDPKNAPATVDGYLLRSITPYSDVSHMSGGYKDLDGTHLISGSVLYSKGEIASIYLLSGSAVNNQNIAWGNNLLTLTSPTIKFSGNTQVTGALNVQGNEYLNGSLYTTGSFYLSGGMEVIVGDFRLTGSQYISGGIVNLVGNETITGNVLLTGQLSMPNSPIISPLYISSPTNDLGFIIQNKTVGENHRTVYVTSAAEWESLFTTNVYNGYDGDILILCGTWTNTITKQIDKAITIYGNKNVVVNITDILSSNNSINNITIQIPQGEKLNIYGNYSSINNCVITGSYNNGNGSANSNSLVNIFENSNTISDSLIHYYIGETGAVYDLAAIDFKTASEIVISNNRIVVDAINANNYTTINVLRSLTSSSGFIKIVNNTLLPYNIETVSYTHVNKYMGTNTKGLFIGNMYNGELYIPTYWLSGSQSNMVSDSYNFFNL